MPQFGHNQPVGRPGTPESRTMHNLPTNVAAVSPSDEDMAADVDEPPDLERTPRPSALKLHESFKASFSKALNLRCDRKESLLSHALHSNNTSPVEETPGSPALGRGMSVASTWSNTSASTAELTSDNGFTSSGTRTRSPSPPLPTMRLPNAGPIFNKESFKQNNSISIVRHDEEHIGPLQKIPVPTTTEKEKDVEVTLGRKRCITFACGGRKDTPKTSPDAEKPAPPTVKVEQAAESAKRACTIKFACPSKVSTNAPSMATKPRMVRAVSPAPQACRPKASPKPAAKHRDSTSTVRNASPISVRKVGPVQDRTRRLSQNSDLARCEAFRFHEFASSEEEVDEWTEESTCHRSRLTISDTLLIENNLRQLGEEVEEEAMDDDDEDQDEDGDDVEMDDDSLNEDEDSDDSDEDEVSDDGFQTDDEEGFAGSDDESDAGSDFAWWAPGQLSTAATSIEHIENFRASPRRRNSDSSIDSAESDYGRRKTPTKGKKSRPVNIRVPSPELPDSTDFVCGTLDEDRPLEEAYLTELARRRAAKHKITPQDIDPTFPTSDPEMDEEDEDDELDVVASESDQHMLMHGQMDPLDSDARGRSKGHGKRSPALSPRRMRSPPPCKRTVHRSPPPRKLFGHSPRQVRSPALGVRMRSPPPSRRGSAHVVTPPPQRRPGLPIRFSGLAERPALTTSSSLPRTPVSAVPQSDDDDGEDTCCELPVRRAIDIKIGLEKKRQRRKEQQYRKLHAKKNGKDKDKRPAPGKGYERMREMGLGLAARRGKNRAQFDLRMPPTPDQKDMHVLSI